MYSGGWAFLKSRKSVKYPHMIRTLPVVQKSLVLRRFCSAYSKNRTKDRASQKRTQAAFIDGIRPAARAASFPPSISASVPALLLIPFQSNKRRGFRCSAIPSTFQISSQHTQRQRTTPARAYINRYNKALPIL